MLWKILILSLISFVCSRNIDPRCSVPNSRPSQNLPHESDCSLFYKCHNGYLLLLPCSIGWIFDENSSSCIRNTGNSECISSTTRLITIPTPPIITATTESETTTSSSTISSTVTSSVTFSIPEAPTITQTSVETEVPIDPDLIPFPTRPILTTIPTAPTITSSRFYFPTPPNIN